MVNSIVRHDVQSLVDRWLQAEREGVQFPVPLHEAWWIAGHSKKQDAFKLAESLLDEGFDFTTECNCSSFSDRKKGRPIKQMFLTVRAFTRFSEVRKIKSKNVEAEIRDLLQLRLGGSIEVETPAGRIDLLTAQEVVEVKTASSWKNAIGQILVYGSYYPSHRKVIYLFGDAHSTFKSMVEKHCKRNKISVFWHLQENNEVRREYLPMLDRIVDSGPRTGWLGE